MEAGGRVRTGVPSPAAASVASATVVVASVVGGATGGTTTTASTVWAMPFVESWPMTTRCAPLIVCVAGSMSRTSPLRLVTSVSSEDLLLLELAGNHVSEDEVL